MLIGILTPSWEGAAANKDFISTLGGWEIAINEYETVSSERVADPTRIAALLKHAPGMVRDLLRVHIGSIGNNYSQLRDLLRVQLVNTAAYDGTGIRIGNGTSASGSSGPPGRKFRYPELMEVYATTKGKSKGRGKIFKGAKGKGKYDGNFGKGHWKGGDGRGEGGGKSGGWTGTPWVPTSSTTVWPNSSSGAEAAVFNGTCGWCGIQGHKRADCRKRQAAASSKGGGKKGAAALIMADEDGQDDVGHKGHIISALAHDAPQPRGPGCFYVGDDQDAADSNAYDDKSWVLAIQRSDEKAADVANIVAGLNAPRFTHALVDSGSDEHVAP